MHKPSLCPGHSGEGDILSQTSKTCVCEMTTQSSPLAALGNNNLYNYGGRKENSSKVVSCRALDAACWVQPWQLPGCLQSMHAVLTCGVSAHLQAKGTVTLQELQTAQHRDRSTMCGCPRTYLAALLPKEIPAQHFPALQRGCGSNPASGSGSYRATLCSSAATGMGHLLLLSRGNRLATALLSCPEWAPACRETAASSRLDTFSSCCSPRVRSPCSQRTPGRQTCSVRHSTRAPPSCSGELSR